MARSKGKEEYWKGGSWASQGYRSEPGVPITAPGAEPDAVLEADQTEAQINANDEEPEVYSPAASTGPNHHPGPRCLAAWYYPTSQAVKISFPATSPASGGAYMYQNVSRDEWTALTEAPSLGRYINDVLSAHVYGRVS